MNRLQSRGHGAEPIGTAAPTWQRSKRIGAAPNGATNPTRRLRETIVRETHPRNQRSAGRGCNKTRVRAYVTGTPVRDTFCGCGSAMSRFPPAINTPKPRLTRSLPPAASGSSPQHPGTRRVSYRLARRSELRQRAAAIVSRAVGHIPGCEMLIMSPYDLPLRESSPGGSTGTPSRDHAPHLRRSRRWFGYRNALLRAPAASGALRLIPTRAGRAARSAGRRWGWIGRARAVGRGCG